MKKYQKQMTAGALCAVLLTTTTLPVYAEAMPGKKQEVVYVMTDASGAVLDIEVVNIFNGGEITDYGDYSDVKILNTTDPIRQENNKISISSAADKVYYQGTMKKTQIPWDISIRYFLDGKEYSASEIAGKSGNLEIRFSVSENAACEGSFYENYALQASFTLDSEKCRNITADGATLANVGSDKQISYTILPGKGIDAAISADVTDFEMDAVSVNGIMLNLNVEIDDEELKSKVDELIDAVKELDDGAVRLSDGSKEALSGSLDLKTGASALQSGNASLDEGIAALQGGLNTVQKGLDSLNAQSSALTKGSAEFQAALKKIQTALGSVSAAGQDLTELTAASGKIKQAVSDLNAGAATLQRNLGYAQYKALMAKNGLNIDELAAGNTNAIGKIEDYEALLGIVSAIPAYREFAEKYGLDLPQLAAQMKGLLKANNAALGGMEGYLNGISAELPALTKGLAELNTQYETFDAAIGKLVVSLGNMTGNLSTLADGINQLTANYEKLDSGIDAYTDGVAQLVAGYGQVMSGVSSLAAGSKELVSGSGELYEGTVRLYDGVEELCGGAKDMAEGTGTFREKTSGMDEEIDEEIDRILDSIGGSMDDQVSFADAKNTDIDSVQFVIKTNAIEKTETETTEAVPEEHLSFWQKLIGLFR